MYFFTPTFSLPSFFQVVRHPLQGEEGPHEVDQGVLVQEAVHGLVLDGAVDEDEAENR